MQATVVSVVYAVEQGKQTVELNEKNCPYPYQNGHPGDKNLD